MQVLAWMWCIVFSMYFGSMWVFGITAIAHVFILSAIVLTVATFETAKRKPTFFLKKAITHQAEVDICITMVRELSMTITTKERT